MTRLVLRALDNIDPQARRFWAARLLWSSLIGWALSAGLLALLGQATFFNEVVMAISWLAITITAVDVCLTSDVRVEQETST